MPDAASAGNGLPTLPTLSVVVAVCDEEACLPEMRAQLDAALDATGTATEVVWVDDGSRDRSWAIICDFARSDPRHRGLRLSRNFGQHVAMRAGIRQARGAAVVLMDADLQDDPGMLGQFVAKWQDGADVVVGVRSSRDDPLRKRLYSRLFWLAINWVSQVPVPPDQAMIRLFSRRACEAFLSMGDAMPFISGQTAWIGFEQTTVPVRTRSRHAGRSKYTLRRALMLSFTAVSSFSSVPLAAIGVLGCGIAGLTLAGAATLFVLKVTGVVDFLTGWTSLVFAISFFSGLTIATMGMVALYVGRVFQQAMNRPQYVVSDVAGAGAGEPTEGRAATDGPPPPVRDGSEL